MDYKIFVYAISLFISVFAFSGINFNNFFRTNHRLEARIFVMLLIISVSYLVSEFIINFVEAF